MSGHRPRILVVDDEPQIHRFLGPALDAAGFEPVKVVPRYLPYSFRGILPPSPLLTRTYLKTPPAWKLLGKQFLVIGRKEG